MPAQGKPFEVFAGEQAGCKQYADQQVAGGAEAADNRQVGDAVIGTVLGAALGAAIGGGRGAAIGAGSGAIFGTAAGAGYGAHTQRGLQFEYDNAYAQCMVAHGDTIVPPPVRYAVPFYPAPVAYIP
jgi:uncharacterized protein YcfJ